ncbi:NUDIX domain-containing protein [Pigmentibacter sp. JX0631]|uniref:NUDIX domain-containing protein n=1 Tax=Pigmentibacter sp. JX0631 TaxID=2976982 RepID=UPI002468CF15|nr:NUDIX domain-containing protein [Pigmentibacter sp. JX0631]WGL61006.1 NUDIX domain-containing protein [Pigmentibacter sp. JX0631]
MKFSIYFVLLKLFKSYQKCVGITTHGVRAVILNKKNEVLLVKHTYTAGWHFPGGGVDKGESPRQAIVRELKEEVAVTPINSPQIIDCYLNFYLGVHDIVTLYIIKEFQIEEFKRNKEIAEAKWFPITELPLDVSKATKKRVAEIFLGQKKVDERW